MTNKEKTKEWVLARASEQEWLNLEKYVSLIEDTNKTMNLTGFSGDTLWKEGIYESLVSLEAAFGSINEQSLLDIGAGAGFPSVPYKIVCPNFKLTIVEPAKKRLAFLKKISQEINLNINLIDRRVEEITNLQFDFVTARAVASLKQLMEIAIRVGKIGTVYAFIKGPHAQQEIMEAKQIMGILKIHDTKIINLDQKIQEKEVNIVVYTKTTTQPKGYPREWHKIKNE